MSTDRDAAANVAEYHALQRANAATSGAAATERALTTIRNRIRGAERRLRSALELMDRGATPEARVEVEAALADLERAGS